MICKYCKHFKKHDNQCGYCLKYEAQALATESCKKIKKIRNDKK